MSNMRSREKNKMTDKLIIDNNLHNVAIYLGKTNYLRLKTFIATACYDEWSLVILC